MKFVFVRRCPGPDRSRSTRRTAETPQQPPVTLKALRPPPERNSDERPCWDGSALTLQVSLDTNRRACLPDSRRKRQQIGVKTWSRPLSIGTVGGHAEYAILNDARFLRSSTTRRALWQSPALFWMFQLLPATVDVRTTECSTGSSDHRKAHCACNASMFYGRSVSAGTVLARSA